MKPPNAVQLTVVPITFRKACAKVKQWHRHHPPPRGHLFSLAVEDGDGEIRGVAIVGRPTARLSQDGLTAEVTRVATDGCPNAGSALYAACWRAARALGYRRLGTYTQASESGASLRGAGWRVVAQRPPHPGWDRPCRPRADSHPTHVHRTLWEAV